jgi:hypothetical protein
MDANAYQSDVLREFKRLKSLADRAMAQVSDDDFFHTLAHDANSIAIVTKHMAGNMRSRWRDFLTTDGEKPDRHRDSEFELQEEETRASILRFWEEGWGFVFSAISPLEPEQMEAIVHIRNEPHTVMQALQRQLSHYAYHVGQIVFLARVLVDENWRSLSVPKGQSQSFNAQPERYISLGSAKP